MITMQKTLNGENGTMRRLCGLTLIAALAVSVELLSLPITLVTTFGFHQPWYIFLRLVGT